MATLSTIECAKRSAGHKAVEEHYPVNPRFVGIGSGSTIVYVVEAIRDSKHINPATTKFVPTGTQSRITIERAGLTPIAFDELPEGTMLDVAFDGADECDEELNLIKGGGACLFQEKLVAAQARKFVCVADYRKAVSRLLTPGGWPTIPIEVAPISVRHVLRKLRELESTGPTLRMKRISNLVTPVRTDQEFFIIDAPFKPLLTAGDVKNGKVGGGQDGVWQVDELARKIKLIEGVLEVGLFHGNTGLELQSKGLGIGGQKPVAAYFGMEDGTVTTRKWESS